MGTLPEDQYTFLTISRSFFPGMKNVSDKRYRENQNPHFTLNIFSKMMPFMRMWKINLVQGRPQMTWCLRIEWGIP
jgi:hypothetical protein